MMILLDKLSLEEFWPTKVNIRRFHFNFFQKQYLATLNEGATPKEIPKCKGY